MYIVKFYGFVFVPFWKIHVHLYYEKVSVDSYKYNFLSNNIISGLDPSFVGRRDTWVSPLLQTDILFPLPNDLDCVNT